MPRILIIDDSPSVLAVVAMMLETAGYEVSTCSNGKCASRRLSQHPIDLIVTDIFMPEQDGLVVIMEARRERPCLPVIAMSGYSGQMDMLPVAKHLGACQLLRKPFTRPQLLEAVEAALCIGSSAGAGPCQ